MSAPWETWLRSEADPAGRMKLEQACFSWGGEWMTLRRLAEMNRVSVEVTVARLAEIAHVGVIHWNEERHAVIVLSVLKDKRQRLIPRPGGVPYLAKATCYPCGGDLEADGTCTLCGHNTWSNGAPS